MPRLGPSSATRTHDLHIPNVARYQLRYTRLILPWGTPPVYRIPGAISRHFIRSGSWARHDGEQRNRRGSNSLPGIPRTALRRFAGTLPYLGFNAPSARVEAASSLRLTKNRASKSDVLFQYGAGDEARTRYLHLGKVALYQMSYARGTYVTIADFFRFVKHRF